MTDSSGVKLEIFTSSILVSKFQPTHNISKCSAGECDLHKASIKPRRVFFDETVEYKWWVWVLDWWALIIMHIRPSLTRMHAPRADCCAVLPSAGLYTSWQFGRLPSEYLATRRILWRYQFSGKCHNVFYSDLRELLEWETWLVVRNSFRVDPVRPKQRRRLQISGSSQTSVICTLQPNVSCRRINGKNVDKKL